MNGQDKRISRWKAAAILLGHLTIAAAAVGLVLLILYWTGVIGGAMSEEEKTVGKDIGLEKVQQFYYTRSSSTDPPDYQRYRFYLQDGKYWFYHEKREGDHWPLTESDVTVSGSRELTLSEQETFLDFLRGGVVTRREVDVSSGKAGPWLYLYWDGDKDVWQQYSFEEPGTVLAFEEFCEGLKGE